MHDSKEATGWYRGKIKLFGVSDAWKANLPNANFLIKYTKKDTGDALQGDGRSPVTRCPPFCLQYHHRRAAASGTGRAAPPRMRQKAQCDHDGVTSGGRPLAAAGSFVVICAVVFWADFAAAGGEEKMAGFHRSVVKLRAGKRPILPLECEIRQATLQPRFHPLDTLL